MPRGDSQYHRSFHARGDAMLAATEAEGEARKSHKQIAEAEGITVARVGQLVAKARQRRAARLAQQTVEVAA